MNVYALQNACGKFDGKTCEHGNSRAEREAAAVYGIVGRFFDQRYKEIFGGKSDGGAEISKQDGQRSRKGFVQDQLP